jgi:hypothetical protein
MLPWNPREMGSTWVGREQSGEQDKQSTASIGEDKSIMEREKMTKRVRRDKEDPSCTE